MLLLHEVHRVAGAREQEFDMAFREGLIPKLAESDDSRLIWYLRLAHGSGAAYTVVTYTACRDASAWAALTERMRAGDLARWSSEVDAMRHGCEAKILTPTVFSPLQEIDLATVPTKGEEHELSLFMEDTAWPFQGGLARYLEKAATLYDHELATSKQRGRGIIELEAAFQPVYGSHTTNEVVLWQRIVNHQALLWMLGNDLPPEATAPGTWMHDALAVRDRWESRILRSAAWSPLY